MRHLELLTFTLGFSPKDNKNLHTRFFTRYAYTLAYKRPIWRFDGIKGYCIFRIGAQKGKVSSREISFSEEKRGEGERARMEERNAYRTIYAGNISLRDLTYAAYSEFQHERYVSQMH